MKTLTEGDSLRCADNEFHVLGPWCNTVNWRFLVLQRSRCMFLHPLV